MEQAARRLRHPWFDAAIFDFDGTMADTAGIWRQVDLAFLERRGLPYTPDYPQRLSTLGFVDGARYTIELYGLDETVGEICAEWMRESAELYRTTVRLRPGVEAYVRSLGTRGIRCALATTNDASVLRGMRHVDVDGLFDACVFGAEVGRGKDHPDIYLEAARRLGTPASSCLVFEDNLDAVRSASRAGMHTCAVRAEDPTQPVEELRQTADLWLDDWRDI